MRMLKSLCLALLAGLYLAGCATPLTKTINVDSQTVPGVDFSQYQTYEWAATAQILNDPDGQWEPVGFDADEEIRFLINREMRKLGFNQVAMDPDLLMVYVAGVDMAALEFKKDPKTKLDVLSTEARGALAIILLDAKTGDAVWAAVADDQIRRPGITTNDAKERLDYAVTKMLKRLPKK